MYSNHLYRVNQWAQILYILQQSLYAEEMVCAMSSQLFYIPETKDLQGNAEMHSHLVPASYHRVTAVGSAQRLANGEQQESIIQTMISCIRNAEAEDKKVREGLKVMIDYANPEVKPFINMIIQWQIQAEAYLAQAKTAFQSFGSPFPAEGQEQSAEYDVY